MKKKVTGREGSQTDPGRHISARHNLHLWVRSGGRCAQCNKYLLEEPFKELPINLSERAHIAGHKSTPGSPRGDSNVPISKRNDADNLVLLCLECHKIVDDKTTRADYPEERLLAIKREHEDRILHLTAMTQDRETTVIRMFGLVRGSVPELARDTAIQAVLDSANRYAKFRVAPDRYSVEIDLTGLPDPESVGAVAYWDQGRHSIDAVVTQVAEQIRQKQIRHLSVFALARIPFLFYLGYALDDKTPVDLYQKQRGDSEGWSWAQSAATVDFEFKESAGASDQVAVLVSLSGTIDRRAIPSELENATTYELMPTGVTPNPNILESSESLEKFSRAYINLLADIEKHHKGSTAIHLFVAAPTTAAISLGRGLMRHVHPALHVYDWVGDGYQKAITVNTQ